MIDAGLATEVWARIVDGRSLQGLGLVTVDGRLDLRGIEAPKVSKTPKKIAAPLSAVELSGSIEVRGRRLEDLDFSRASLESLRLMDCKVENCSFQSAICRDWRLWRTDVAGCNFTDADLRKSALGPVSDGRPNRFVDVTFIRTDFRGTSYVSAEFDRCAFDACNLRNVDFQGTRFSGCRFSGLLDGVIFQRTAFRGDHLSPNDMRDVDLRAARLKFVEFRKLDMGTVRWPEDEDHIKIPQFAASLDRAIRLLRSRSDNDSAALATVLESQRKWAGSHQELGVVSRLDLLNAADSVAVEEVVRMLESRLE